jgi:TELO2-interacting protein 1
VKQVLQGLQAVETALTALVSRKALDEKLAEYAFFPLTHVFNEAQKLSSACLESAVSCVSILAAEGWGPRIAPNMGKQLLILMTLIGGPDPKRQQAPPTDELREASLHCIGALVESLTSTPSSKPIFDDPSVRSIVDQVTYMLLDAITESRSGSWSLPFTIEPCSRLFCHGLRLP